MAERKDKVNEQKEPITNMCCDCKEGCILGKNVYCSVDGRFHLLHDRLTCKSFIPKNMFP